MPRASLLLFLIACAAFAQNAPGDQAKNYPEPRAGDYVAHNFRFASGESLAEVRIHYYTLGTPQRDASGMVRNAVLILHGTGGSGRQFFGSPQSSANFAEQLFGPGELLDAARYFIVMPDNVGHGGSSKPSDGLRMKFPHYDYTDMVRLQHDLLTEGLHVNHLRLVMGTSMGCMHSWVWAEMYSDFMDAAMPLACEPAEIAGRNRIWRKSLIDAIRNDPKWNEGNYTEEPIEGLTDAEHLLIIVGLAPLQAQKTTGTREAAEKLLADRTAAALKTADANDMLYYFDASLDYNPEPDLEKIRVPVMAVNSADDFINPPELGIMERDIRRVAKGHYVLIPISDETRGHGSHTVAKLWKEHLAELLQESQGQPPAAAPTQAAAGPSQPPATGPCASLTAPDLGPIYSPGPGITNPKPISTPEPEYPEELRRSSTTFGGAKVCILIGADGLVHAAQAVSAAHPAFANATLATVRQWRFKPAMKDGAPVAVRVMVETTFDRR